MNRARWSVALCVATLLVAASMPALANSFTDFEGTISAGGINFDVKLAVDNNGFDTNTLTCTVANCAYSLTFTGTNTNATTSTLNAFALQLFGNGSNASFDLSGGYTIPAGWIAVAGAKINNGNPGLGCNPGNGVTGWLCGSATMMSNVLQIGAGQMFTMNFAGNFQNGTLVTSPWHLMAHGLTNVNSSTSIWAISQDFEWTRVPEPGPLTVIVSTLFSAGALLRRKLFA